MNCRICRRSDHLKYSAKQLRLRRNISNFDVSGNDFCAGNICWDCEDKLANFDKISDLQHDVDATSDDPVVVDDEELSNIFRRQAYNSHGDFSSEVIEISTSGENSPDPSCNKPIMTIDLDSDTGETNFIKDDKYNYVGSVDLSSGSEIEVGGVEFNTDNFTAPVTMSDCQPLQNVGYVNSIKCPECSVTLACSMKYVQHMRTQHRTYTGEDLREQRKSHNDSAMTIRLIYISRYSFYECNLCGKIHNEYHIHRQHIKTEHAEESKRLKDPTVILCPLCHKECETNPELCKHIREIHETESSKFLKKVKHKKVPGFDSKNLAMVEETSCVYRLIDRETCYYECRKCSNFTIGHLNHWRHLQKHLDDNKKTNKSKKSMLEVNSVKYREVLKKNGTGKIKILNDNRSLQTNLSKIQTNFLASNNFKKPQNDIKRRQRNQTRSKVVKERKFLNSKTSFSARTMLDKTVKKVFNLTFVCQHCLLAFTNFTNLNLHLILKHQNQDFFECEICKRNFSDQNLLERHIKAIHFRCNACVWCNQVFNTSVNLQMHKRFSHKRKFRIDNENVAVEPALDENKNLRVDTSFANNKSHQSCLSDLIRVSKLAVLAEKNQTTYIPHQCPYCTQLYLTHRDLCTHVKTHDLNGDVKLIKK